MHAAAQSVFERFTAALLVLTMGAKGAIGITRAGICRVEAAPVAHLQDTVGAGDVFQPKAWP